MEYRAANYYALPLRRALIVEMFQAATASSAYFENMTIHRQSVRHDGSVASCSAALYQEMAWGRTTHRAPTFDDITVLIRRIRCCPAARAGQKPTSYVAQRL